MNKKLTIGTIIAIALSGALWFSEIPQGIWLARTAYHSQTINGQIEAVKAENARLQKQLKDGQAAATPTPTATPSAGGGS